MADIKNTYFNYVKWTLKSETKPTLQLQTDPGKWSDDSLEIVRHKSYHGIFTQFTNQLEFYGEERDYIIEAYNLGGINTDLRLTKYILRDKDGEVKWVEFYSGLADFKTMIKTVTAVKINFNSNDLAELIKSHESDEFEIEREDSIDEVQLDPLVLKKTEIKGRELASGGESILLNTGGGIDVGFQGHPLNGVTFLSELISEGHPRFVSVDTAPYDHTDPTASNCFFVNGTGAIENDLDVTIQYKMNGRVSSPNIIRYYKVRLLKLLYNEQTTIYTEADSVILDEGLYVFNYTSTLGTNWYEASFDIEGSVDMVVGHYNALAIVCETYEQTGTTLVGTGAWATNEFNLKINVRSFYDPSPSLSFLFVKDVIERLMYILTGEQNNVESRLFHYNDADHSKDGKYGLVGLMSGYWVRAFNPDSEKYKSLTTSLRGLLDSLKVVFNVGIGIERIENKETLVIEDLKHFYRERTVVRLPYQISNVKRSVEKSGFFSGTETGYTKGGDYENEIGLDEPNTKLNTVTPIRKSDKKYTKLSKIRADEYGMEIARRKPQETNPDEDTRYDDDNWFLDLKRQFLEDGITQAPTYTQSDWDDRLDEINNIHSPQTFRSMLFTPLTILFRHGWILRAGMEQYREKFVKYISGDNNTTLSMLWKTDQAYGVPGQTYAENDDVKVDDLERSRFELETVDFTHAVDNDLMDWILGKTTILEDGIEVEVPNWYFKVAYTNEYGDIERGYIMEIKPQGEGSFKILKANEKLL